MLTRYEVTAIVIVSGCWVGVALYQLLRKPKPGPKVKPTMDFEFGETRESEAFFDRNPKFMPMFVLLMDVANKYLGDRPLPKNAVEDVCFGLGHACRQDFLEVIFLAVNGYGVGASKLTRGLYERSVALGYIVQDQTKAERFVRYAAIQEHKVLVAALKVVREAQFDAFMKTPNTAAEIRERFQEIKPEFQMTDCKKCDTKRTQPSWDVDVSAMVHKLGGLYKHFYLPNYSLPNLEIHATLASASVKESMEAARQEADLQVLCASFLMLLALRSQESVFKLGLEKDLDACEEAVNDLRPQRNEV
jgi:hypothetical protein